MAATNKQKSVLKAYLCWLLGGMFGLHLFYLRRDAQAFLTWCTFGGYGIGWLGDITKIPRYVRECNEDPKYIKELIELMKQYKTPPFSFSRFISAITIGYLWGQLAMLAIPEEIVGDTDWTFLQYFIPIAVALGVWVVGNIGRQQGDLWPTIVVSYLSYPSRWLFHENGTWITIVAFFAALGFDHFSKQWRRKPRERKSTLKRVLTVFFCGVIYISLWSSYVYFNATITDEYGDEIPVREALHHFFRSTLWTELKQSLYDVYQYGQHHGWYEIWKQIIELSDPQGEQNAYKLLGLSSTASQAEITKKWRALSREFHPDKEKNSELKQKAQEKFMDIQQAYETLSSIKNKRRKKNRKWVEETSDNE